MAPRHNALAQFEERVTVIGPTIVVRGRIEGGESVRIEGRVEGSIAVDDTIFIAPAAIVAASLHARQVIVEGIVVGDIEAEVQVILKASARILGNIRAPRVQIAEGSSLRGEVDMGEYTPDADRAGSRAATRALAPRARPAVQAAPREQAPARPAAAAAPARAKAASASSRNATAPGRAAAPRAALATHASRSTSRRAAEAEPIVPVNEPFRGREPELDDADADYELHADDSAEVGDEGHSADENEAESAAESSEPTASRQAQPRMPARGKQRLHQR